MPCLVSKVYCLLKQFFLTLWGLSNEGWCYKQYVRNFELIRGKFMRAICWVNGLLVSDSQNSWYAAFKLRLPALKEFKFLLHQVLLTDKKQTLFYNRK